MKKGIIIISSILIIVSIIIYSCAKINPVNDTELVLYENTTNQMVTKAGFLFGENTKKVSKIDYHNSVLANLRNSNDWNLLLAKYDMNLDNINKTTYYGSSIELITIPLKSKSTDESYLNIFVYNHKFVITKMSITSLENKNKQIVVSTTDNDIYYQFQLNPENKLGKWVIFKDVPINETFSSSNIDSEKITTFSKETWYQCMNRLIAQTCYGDWLCSVLCTAALPSCLGAAALVCALQ